MEIAAWKEASGNSRLEIAACQQGRVRLSWRKHLIGNEPRCAALRPNLPVLSSNAKAEKKLADSRRYLIASPMFIKGSGCTESEFRKNSFEAGSSAIFFSASSDWSWI